LALGTEQSIPWIRQSAYIGSSLGGGVIKRLDKFSPIKIKQETSPVKESAAQSVAQALVSQSCLPEPIELYCSNTGYVTLHLSE